MLVGTLPLATGPTEDYVPYMGFIHLLLYTGGIWHFSSITSWGHWLGWHFCCLLGLLFSYQWHVSHWEDTKIITQLQAIIIISAGATLMFLISTSSIVWKHTFGGSRCWKGPLRALREEGGWTATSKSIYQLCVWVTPSWISPVWGFSTTWRQGRRWQGNEFRQKAQNKWPVSKILWLFVIDLFRCADLVAMQEEAPSQCHLEGCHEPQVGLGLFFSISQDRAMKNNWFRFRLGNSENPGVWSEVKRLTSWKMVGLLPVLPPTTLETAWETVKG